MIRNDPLVGEFGNDTMNGGQGADVFVFELGIDNGVDTITDFNPGLDKLDIQGMGFDALTFQAGDAGLTISWEGGTVELADISLPTLLEEDFL